MQNTRLSDQINYVRTYCFVSELITIRDDQVTPKSHSVKSSLVRCGDRSLVLIKKHFLAFEIICKHQAREPTYLCMYVCMYVCAILTRVHQQGSTLW